MRKIISEKIQRILINKDKLEKLLNLNITNDGKEVSIEGNPEDEYVGEKVIDALNFGFPFQASIKLKEEDIVFEIINIKEYAKTHNLERIRARLIGKNGKCLKTLAVLSECDIELKDNQIGLIGDSLCIRNVRTAIISLIQGSKQANVYCFLEKHQVEPVFDYGLRERKPKNKK